MIKIIVDAMGGDNAPAAPVEGAVKALSSDREIYVILLMSASILFCTSQGENANVKLESTQLATQNSITAVATLIINPLR